MLGGRRAVRDFHRRDGAGRSLRPQPGQPTARPPGPPSPSPPPLALLILQDSPAAGSVRHPESSLEILQHQGKSSKGWGGLACGERSLTASLRPPTSAYVTGFQGSLPSGYFRYLKNSHSQQLENVLVP